MMNKIAAPRGTADLLPPESVKRQAFESRAREIARRFGYGEIRTPMFEATELFVRGVGETTDIVEKEMYTFTDKGGRSMTLRPEWTAPVVRAALEHNLFGSESSRLYYIGPIFRYERPQAGRLRQAHQFGVECFGYERPEADAEVIQLAHEMLRSHNLKTELRINSIGCETCRVRFRDELAAYFTTHRESLSADSQRRLDRNPLRLLDSKAAEDQLLVASAPSLLNLLCEDCAAHFASVRVLLDAIGVPYLIDPHIVRGLDYYTRTVFEFVSEDLGAQSTVCAGGRYDGLVRQLGGRDVPAVGFAMGVERFLMIAERGERELRREGIVFAPMGERALKRLTPLLAELRRNADGLSATMDYGSASLGSQIKWANRRNARAVLLAGDDELAARTLVLRDLEDRTQHTIEDSSDVRTAARLVLERYRELMKEKAPA